MKFHSLFLLGLLATASVAHIPTQCGNTIENWFFGPSNNDPRVLGLSIAGGAVTIIGAMLVKNGIEQTFAPSKDSNYAKLTPSWCLDCIKIGLSRTCGLIVSALGTGLTAGGLGLLFFNKDMITEYNKFSSGYYDC